MDTIHVGTIRHSHFFPFSLTTIVESQHIDTNTYHGAFEHKEKVILMIKKKPFALVFKT